VTSLLVIRGTVVHGEKRGRLLGFPTANVPIPREVRPPNYGIYAGLADGRWAAISVGVRPTFGDGLEPLLEAHLLDWDGDLYGREIEVALYERIRPELKFTTAEELVTEIQRDVDRVREIMSALAPDADPARVDGAGPPASRGANPAHGR
jgi:riboflavin kinase / FMN adenylyltransferase